ncbi:HD domain-containing protein [Laceyella putida]|uniref:HD domain-containing protein n=1 Tax=Laceyella putida TaxID=110101 RepID=A0ABW2RKX3_9BACL
MIDGNASGNRRHILHEFPWLQALSQVPQDPEYHGEGDVLTHTWMVVDELSQLPAWQILPHEEQSLLFMAALFHDIGKEPCTQMGEDGRFHAPHHAKVGAQMIREKMFSLPIHTRENLVQLVRYHGLPLWFFEKPDPERAVITASWHIRLDWVALLAEADVRGRICPDQPELLERIEIFRQYATELKCYTQPLPFANAHTLPLFSERPSPSD